MVLPPGVGVVVGLEVVEEEVEGGVVEGGGALEEDENCFQTIVINFPHVTMNKSK